MDSTPVPPAPAPSPAPPPSFGSRLASWARAGFAFFASRPRLLLSLALALAALILVSKFRGCLEGLVSPFGPSKVEGLAPGTKIERRPFSLSITPPKSKANPQPTPEEIPLAPEDVVYTVADENGNTTARIDRFHFLLQPYAGLVFPLGEGFKPELGLGLRLVHWSRFGAGPVLSKRVAEDGPLHLSAILDYRIDNMTLGLGPGWSFDNLTAQPDLVGATMFLPFD